MVSKIERIAPAWFFSLFLLMGTATQAETKPLIRVLLLGESGTDSTTPILRRLLVESGRFDVKISEVSAGLNAATLEGFDLVVDNGAGTDAEKPLAAFVEAGKGLLVARGALVGSPTPTAAPVIADGSTTPVRFVTVKATHANHPILAGMPTTYKTADAIPCGLMARASAEVLLTADAGEGDMPALAVSRRGTGRIAALALGANASALHEPQVIATLARAAEWATTGNVTLPATYKHPRPAPGAVRGLVITGGHDHEALFYSLFSGHDDLGFMPVDTATNAFKKDLRGKYDVVIMYDFTRELDDDCRKNLRNFVEAGGGIVVLHHALLNFQEWAWWSEEVVGGRYRLQREGNEPSSVVKDDQEIFATPAADHPILSGIEPFHIKDEAYKRLSMSPKIRPLLTTDNPTSDTNLAWIGPCQSARIVAIQLGHGHSAFAHPTYRSLVHNAVLWSAGKLK